MKHIKLFVAAAIMLLSLEIGAQQSHGTNRPAPPKMKTPEEIAKQEADMMKAEVGLTDKQYKKVYKLIKKDHEYRQEQARNQFAGMGGPGGMPGGMGGPGGGSMGGGMPPDGGMCGPGSMPAGPGRDIVTDEYLEKQDQKLKKILSEEQYSKWRSKHPAEHLELPPLKMD